MVLKLLIVILGVVYISFGYEYIQIQILDISGQFEKSSIIIAVVGFVIISIFIILFLWFFLIELACYRYFKDKALYGNTVKPP